MLNGRKYGFKNEYDTIRYLNEKHFNELNEKWQKHLKRMFPNISDGDVINAFHYEDRKGKPDIFLMVGEEKKYISIKTGRNSSMHQESFDSFCSFLRSQGVSKRTLHILFLYHYGKTSKVDNNGVPYRQKELEQKFKEYFLQASQELDRENLIKAVIERTIIKGCVESRKKIDFLYYGNLEQGYLLSNDDICKIILNYREHGKSAIHFGGLNYQPNSRDPHDPSHHDTRIRWPILSLLYYRTEQELNDIISGKMRV